MSARVELVDGVLLGLLVAATVASGCIVWQVTQPAPEPAPPAVAPQFKLNIPPSSVPSSVCAAFSVSLIKGVTIEEIERTALSLVKWLADAELRCVGERRL